MWSVSCSQQTVVDLSSASCRGVNNTVISGGPAAGTPRTTAGTTVVRGPQDGKNHKALPLPHPQRRNQTTRSLLRPKGTANKTTAFLRHFSRSLDITMEVFGLKFPSKILPTAWASQHSFAGRDIREVSLHEVCYKGLDNDHLRSFANGRYLNVIFARSIKESVFSQTVLTAVRESKLDLDQAAASFCQQHNITIDKSKSEANIKKLQTQAKIHLSPPNHRPAPNVKQPQAPVLNQLPKSSSLLYPPLMPIPRHHQPKHHPPIFSLKHLLLMAVLCNSHLQLTPQHQQHQGLSTSELKSSTSTRRSNSNWTEPSKASAKL